MTDDADCASSDTYTHLREYSQLQFLREGKERNLVYIKKHKEYQNYHRYLDL